MLYFMTLTFFSNPSLLSSIMCQVYIYFIIFSWLEGLDIYVSIIFYCNSWVGMTYPFFHSFNFFSIIYVCQYEHMDSYFNTWVITHYNYHDHFLRISQIWVLGVLSCWLLYPSGYVPGALFWGIFLVVDTKILLNHFGFSLLEF